ncbi:MAG: FAD-dependent oxidoreductase [Owenweeksia sp.]|nr:FAD-dependent oxidoreductase [Owenweeksia sp.]
MSFLTPRRPVPAIADLELDNAGITHSKKGIQVNEFMQSVSNPQVYAAGDAADTDGLPLTPVAVSCEGHILASNIIKGNEKPVDYDAIPSVVFTLPSMAGVGFTEKES